MDAQDLIAKRLAEKDREHDIARAQLELAEACKHLAMAIDYAKRHTNANGLVNLLSELSTYQI